MKTNAAIQALMMKFNMTHAEALNKYEKGVILLGERIDAGDMPLDFCEEQWGLEPDFLDDLLLDLEMGIS